MNPGTTSTAGSGATPAQTAGDLEQQAIAHIDESELVALTQHLVRQHGQNPPGEEAETVAALIESARARGLDVRTSSSAAGRDNVHVTTPGHDGGAGLLLLGHTDVVPVGDGWSVDPFGGIVRNRRVYGRGSTDMKGGLAASLIAMTAVQRAADEAGTRLTGPIELAATVDEEEGGTGIRHLMSEVDAGYLGCITAEPTDLQTIIAARGDCYLDITVHGVAAHAGRPSDGCNAIYGAARVVASLRQWHDELQGAAHPLAGAATWSVGRITGGQGTAIVPAHCVVQADRRLLPGEDPATVLDAVRRRVEGLHLEDDGLSFDVTMPMNMPGFDTPAEDSFALVVDDALRRSGGPGMPLGGWTAACDGGYIARDLHVPTVVLGPGSVNDQAHRPDESVGVDELMVAARTYASVAARMLGPAGTARRRDR